MNADSALPLKCLGPSRASSSMVRTVRNTARSGSASGSSAVRMVHPFVLRRWHSISIPVTPFMRNCFLTVLFALVLGGCSREGRLSSTLERAEIFFAAGEYEKAEISYLNVLQMDPRHPGAIRRLGEIYHAEGRWGVAAPFLIQARQTAPDDPEVRLRLAMVLLAANESDRARNEALVVLAQQPTNREAVLILCDAVRGDSDMVTAREEMGKLRQQGGDHPVLHVGEAGLLLRESKLADAELAVREALRLDPEFDAAHLVLATVLSRQGREEAAREAYAKGHVLAPRHSLRKLAWPNALLERGESEQARQLLLELHQAAPQWVTVTLLLARSALKSNDLEAAEQWLGEVIARDPQNTEALFLDAQLKLARGQTADAVGVLEGLSRRFPQSARVWLQLGQAQGLSDNPAGALTSLRRALELSPESTAAGLLLAQTHLRRADPLAALAVLNEVLRREPGLRAARLLLAEARRQNADLDQAAALYRQLVAEDAKDIQARYGLGQILLLQGKPAEARAVFEDLLEVDRGHLPAMTLLAELDVREENLPAAVDRTRAQIARNVDAPGPRFLLAQVYMAQGDSTAAEAELKEVIRLAPEFQPAYLVLARMYSLSNRVAEARQQLGAVLQQDPEDAPALLLLATMDETEGEFAAARLRYEKVLEKNPRNLFALNNLAYLHVDRFRDLDRALELAATAREAAPRDPFVGDTFGWILFQRAEYAQALAPIRQAAAQLATKPEVLYHLGMAAYMNGDERLARQSFASALNLPGEFAHREEASEQLVLLDIEPGTADPQLRQTLSEALRKRPADPVALKRLGAVYERDGDQARLRELYERALEAAPGSVPVLAEFARICLDHLREASRAMNLARTARKLAPQDAEVAHTLGRLAFRSGDHAWAVSLLTESAGQRPEAGLVQYDLALALYSVGRLDEARTAMQNALDGKGSSVDAEAGRRFLTMAVLHETLGNPEAAKRAAQEVLQVAPGDIPATMVLGLVAERTGDAQQARQAYQAVLTRYPQFIPAMKRLAVLSAEQLSDDETAYQMGLKARETLRQDAELTRTLGMTIYRRGEYRYAAQLLSECMAAYPNDPDVWYHLGLAQVRIGNTNAGRQSLSQAIALAPNHALAPQARETLAAN